MQPTYWFNGVHTDQLPELDGIVFDAYMQGLADMGWQGDRALVRLGYTASISLRLAYGIFNVEWASRNPATRKFIEDVIEHPMEEIFDVMRSLRTYVVGCAEDARQLIASPAVKALAR